MVQFSLKKCSVYRVHSPLEYEVTPDMIGGLMSMWMDVCSLTLISIWTVFDSAIYRTRHLSMCKRVAPYSKGRHKRESKNAKQMQNTKQNCFSHSSVSPRNDKHCSDKQCFANQTNRCQAGFASRSDLFLDNTRLTKHRRKVNQRHLILQAMYTTMWLEIDCWLAVSHMFR